MLVSTQRTYAKVLFSQHFQVVGSLQKPATADDQRGTHGPLIGLVRPDTLNPPLRDPDEGYGQQRVNEPLVKVAHRRIRWECS